MEDLEFKIEDEWLWIEDRHLRFEDFDCATPTFVANHAILRTL